MSTTIAQVRAVEYPHLDGHVFFNAASYGPLPQRALAAMERYQGRRAAALLAPGDFSELLPRARTALAALIGARPTEIALCPNTNVGVNIAASIARQRRRRGDARTDIVVSAREFPANVYPWLALQQDGFRVRLIDTDELGRPREDALLEAVDSDDVAVLALSAVQFASGFRSRLEVFGELCQRRNILFSVDAIQAAGAVPIDVRRAQVDVLVAGGQKWLCGPFGTGFAFVREPLCRSFEPELPGWLAFGATTDFNRLCSYDYDLLDDARRFEVGTLSYPDFTALAESIELLLDIGIEQISAHAQQVLQPLFEWADSRADVVITSATDPAHRSAITCVRTADVNATFAALCDAGVACVLREGAIRFAPHFYNTVDEMHRVVQLLDQSV